MPPLTPPDGTPGTTPPPANDPPTPPPQPTPPSLEDLGGKIEELPPQWQAYVKELRGEAKEHRLAKNAAKDELAAVKARNAELEKARAEAEEAKLLEEKKYKELWEAERQKVSSENQRWQKSVIESEIKAIGTAAGVNPKVLKMIDRTGIRIEDDGSVHGVELAIEKFKTENPEFVVTQGGAPPANGGATPPATPPGQLDMNNPTSWMKVPGTNLTYDEYAKTMGGTPNMAPAGAPPAEKLDLLTATPEQVKQWEAKFKAGLKGK